MSNKTYFRLPLYDTVRSKQPQKFNGVKKTLEETPLDFNLENLEKVLQQQFGEVTIKGNEWSIRHGRPSYDLYVHAGRQKTIEEIKESLYCRFRLHPLGEPRLLDGPGKISLFLYYLVGPARFNVKFSDVISPYRKG